MKLCNDNLKEDDSCSNSNLLDLEVNDHANYMGYDMTLELLTCQWLILLILIEKYINK